MTTSDQVVKTSTNNSPSQDCTHPKNQTTPSYVTPQFKPFPVMAHKLLKKIRKLSTNQSHYYVFLVFHQVPDNPQMPETKKMRIFVNNNSNYCFLWEQPSIWVLVCLENKFMSSCYCRLWDEVTKPGAVGQSVYIIMLHSWAKHFPFIVPISNQEYKWILVSCLGSLMKCWGGDLEMD